MGGCSNERRRLKLPVGSNDTSVAHAAPQHTSEKPAFECAISRVRPSLRWAFQSGAWRRAKVRPWECAAWCDDIGQPCPQQMPRTDLQAANKSGEPKTRRAPPSSPEYLRQADLIPALVPFSPATLWRHVKSGKFPAPIKLSASITAWRRTDYEAWAASHVSTSTEKRKRRSR